MDSTTELAIRGAAHAVRDMAQTISTWGRDALGAVERAAKAWERLAEAHLEERAAIKTKEVKP